MIGAFLRFKEEGDFTFYIKIPKSYGLKNDPIFTFLAIR